MTVRHMTWALVVAIATSVPVNAFADDMCGTFELTGASSTAGDPEVSFVEAWRSQLRDVVACLQRSEAARACAELQGQFDEKTFAPAVERALGGQRAAQLLRAQGRSDAVATELDAMGVPYARIRRRPPSPTPTYRGVRVRIVADCLDAPTQTPLPEWLASPESVAVALGYKPPPPAPPPTPPAPLGPFSLDAGVGLSGLFSRPDDALGVAVVVGAGWQNETVYVRARGAFGSADQDEQRRFFEWGGSVGTLVRPWLRVGGLFVSRVASYELAQSWYEQAWFLGAESEQRLVELGPISVWASESIAPLGMRTRRGIVVDGAPVDVPDRLDYALRLDAQILVRGNFGL